MTTPTPPGSAADPDLARPAGLPFDTVALVLQGGGALGAYQAGVCQGLAAAGIEPNWIAGISIGALNTAIIAGNPPETRIERLREFWETICRPAFAWPSAEIMQAWVERGGAQARRAFSAFEAWRAMVEGQQAFFVPRGVAPWFGTEQPVDEASFYDTRQLKATLERYVDFDRINAGPIRVSVGAVNVRTGNFEYFDNTVGHWKHRLRAEHFMASGALPPAFPAIEIEGEYYWDGGLVSNTPLAHVLEAVPRRDTLVFQVDLWSAVGVLPRNVYEVQERIKDIQYSSRTRAVTDGQHAAQTYRRLLRALLDRLPPEADADDALRRQAQALACSRQYAVIHLIYRDKEWEGLAKDYEFSPQTMHEHWASGLADIERSLQHRSWLELPPDGREFVTHDAQRAG